MWKIGAFGTDIKKTVPLILKLRISWRQVFNLQVTAVLFPGKSSRYPLNRRMAEPQKGP
jgi:hypothetical protein